MTLAMSNLLEFKPVEVALSTVKPIRTIGFTGTRNGMTVPQRLRVMRLLVDELEGLPQQKLTFRHGCCLGSDEQAATVAAYLGFHVIAHVPYDRRRLSSLAYDVSDQVMPGEEYLARDRTIVNLSNQMIATPREYEEQSRGGTWYTIRWAIKMEKSITICFPDGSIRRV